MKVCELIRAVLRNMNEETDAKTVSIYADEILDYINEGYREAVITKIKPVKTVKLSAVDGKIKISDIGDDFFEISKFMNSSGFDARFSFNSEYIFANDGDYTIEYVYIPKDLKDDDDQPVFNSGFHYILSDYATYRMFLRGSSQRQKRGEAFYRNYYNGLLRLCEKKQLRITNKFGSENYGRV